jgi:hypothetical protein
MNDRLDDFFEREREAVPLLVPPAGRYDELQTIARRRRNRNTTVVSAAAAVVLAVAGTGVVLGAQNLGGHTNNLAGPATLSSTAAHANSASPSGPPVDAPVPAGFSAWSVSFVSNGVRGFALGGYPCGSDQCFGVLETTDSMTSWHLVAAPGLSAEYGLDATTAIIRFSGDGTNGWMVGSQGVWASHDEGRSWHPIAALQDQHIDALEAWAGRTYALGAGGSDLWVSSDSSSDGWAPQSSLALAVEPTGTGGTTDSLATANNTVAAVRSYGSTTTVRVSGDRGDHWSTVPSPCGTTTGQAPLFSLVDEFIGRFACNDGSVYGVRFGNNQPVLDASFSLSSTTGAAVKANSSSTISNGTFFAYSGAGIWAYLANHTASHVLAGDISYVGLTNDTQGIALPAQHNGKYWVTQTGGLSWLQRSWG